MAIDNDMNVRYIHLVNTGNEGLAQDFLEELDSGRVGRNQKTAQLVDQMFEAKGIDAPGSREMDLSAAARIEERNAFDRNQMPHPTDTDGAIQALYGSMLPFVPQEKLDAAMESQRFAHTDLDRAEYRGLFDNVATLGALYTIAQGMKMQGVMDYVQEAHAMAAGHIRDLGLKGAENIASLAPTAQQPQMQHVLQNEPPVPGTPEHAMGTMAPRAPTAV